jgi:hypothetical protein
LQVAIVYPGDREVRRLATRDNNRFAALFAAFERRGVDAHPAVYHRDEVGALRQQLLGLDGALVWVNPIDAGHSRAPLDALLRGVAKEGVLVSTHPDVIMKLGTKDVLVDTREMGWGSDVHRVDSLEQLQREVGGRVAVGGVRVLKQWRGHSGQGVWRIQAVPTGREFTADSPVLARQAQRGSDEVTISFAAFVEMIAPYFESGGHMIDQAWQPRLTEGMVRCYVVQDRVEGYGLQAVNALYPARDPASGEAVTPGPRLYHPPNLPHLEPLKTRLETEWIPQLQRMLGIAGDELPLLWDCDFLHGDRTEAGAERYVLCEINVSSVAPFPDSVIEPLASAAIARIESARSRRT